MKIDAIDEKSVLVELSKEDLEKRRITYEELDYANERTKNLVRNILETIRLETGKAVLSCSSLEVEVMPDSFGGCLMIFKQGKENAGVETEQTTVFFSENINNFIDSARALKNLEAKEQSDSLYRADGTFFLLVSGCCGKKRCVLSEYLDEASFDEARLNSLREYGECLIEKDALTVLSA